MPRTTFPALFAFAVSLCAHAAERTIEAGPFTITHTLAATILPEKDSTSLPQIPELWSEWVILSILPHGTQVAKNDVLLEFDTLALKRKIEDTRTAITSKTLGLAQAEQDLVHLQTTSKHQLESLRTKAGIAREELEYFTKTRRNAEERSADQSLERAKQYLANQEEELRQLQKMYEADDLTEDTEEIILIRQKNAVKAATFALEMETLSHKRTREVLLPRGRHTGKPEPRLRSRSRRSLQIHSPLDRTQVRRSHQPQNIPPA
jgi:multidrug efflux pump subunit AcrA (membrane-fusion protein)